MISRLIIKGLQNQRRLLQSKHVACLFNPVQKRDLLKIVERINKYPDMGEYIYRNKGMKQATNDYWLSMFMMTVAVFCSSATVYMNWEEYKIADPPGYHQDLSRFSDAELGIPTDDELGYAPLKPELLKDGKLNDIGNTLRGENRQVYYVDVVRQKISNPYDM